MGDKTIFIIVIAINIFFWWLNIDLMIKIKQSQTENEKRMKDYMAQCHDYWHNSFQSINKMVQINAESMGRFIEQISGIMLNKAETGNEEKTGK